MKVVVLEEKFRALGHEVRLKIYRALQEEKLCVCELTELLDMSQPAVSQHLSKLKNADLIEPERQGQWTFYHRSSGRFTEAIGDLLEETPGSLHRSVNEIKNKNLCELRDPQGNLPEEG